ncbi:MAG: helix-turn-helix domain-containing protein [Bacillota bacterium]|nr:helix-turn-helix domain-containing protein [Bacillota bacterium]
MYQIGQFSQMSKTTIKTLRYYDEIGLLKPEQVDDFTGYRFYSTQQLLKLHYIQAFKQIGLSINEIKIIMSGQSEMDILKKHKSELNAEMERITDQLSRIEFFISGKEEESFMSYQAIIKDLPECIVYYKRLTVPSYDAYFKIIPAIGQECMKANPDIKCSVPE